MTSPSPLQSQINTRASQILYIVAEFLVSGRLILDQVPNKDIQPLKEKEPRPSFYSRLFSRNTPLPDVPSPGGGWIPPPGIDRRELGSPFHEDEGIANEYDGDAVDDVQAYLEDED